jgi:cytochrome c oxidase assembly factor 6
MGWFSLWSSPAAPQKAPDGGSIAPNRTSRDQCYLARDFFFDCLEENNIVDSLKHEKEARSKCGKEIREFEAACSATWVWETSSCARMNE